MATDNPLLAGMLGGIELARATMGNQLAQQQATLQSVLQMQQMQMQAAQSRQLFEMRQVEMLADTKLKELELNSRVKQADAAVKLAALEAPIREKELRARLLDAQNKNASANAEIQQRAIDSGATDIYHRLNVATYGISNPTQYRGTASAFLTAEADRVSKLPEAERNFAVRSLQAATSKFQTDEMDRAKLARDKAFALTEKYLSYAASSGDEKSLAVAGEMVLAEIGDIEARSGVDFSGVRKAIKGTSGKTAAEVAQGYIEGASSYAGDWRQLERDPQGVAAGENTSLLEKARANADSLLRDFAGVQTNPEARRLMGTAGQLLNPVLNATRKGLTEPSWIGKAFGQGAAVDKQVSMVASPFGFGEVPATTRKVRSLTASELAELSKSDDPRRVLDILTSAVVSVNEPEPQAPPQYIPGF